ncbi:MAG: CHAT domain-containing protein [Acidobacteriota bacterium]
MRKGVGAVWLCTPRPLRSAVPGILLAGALLSACKPAADPLPPTVEVTVRGHYEVASDGTGGPVPLFLQDEGHPPGLCLLAPLSLDMSAWRSRLAWRDPRESKHPENGRRALGAAPEDWRPPDITMTGAGTGDPTAGEITADSSVVCFLQKLPAGLTERSRLELCGEIETGGGEAQRVYRLPCRRVIYEPNPRRYRRIWATGCAPGASPEARAKASAEAVEAGYPLLRVFIDLLRVDRLRRSRAPRDLDEARRLLDSMPPLLSAPVASDHAGQVLLQSSLVDLAEQRLSRAWGNLQAADRAFLRVASPLRISVLQQQAEILRQVGAPTAARQILRRGLGDAETAPPWLRAGAAEELAWMILLDPTSDDAALDEAARHLDAAQQLARSDEAVEEQANRWLNRALLSLRRGSAIDRPLARARALLEGAEANGRVRYLRRWMTLLEGLAALEGGETGLALRRCKGLLEDAELGRMVAWAASCVGRAKRLDGASREAFDAFALALAVHEGLSPLGLGQGIPPTPGLRADAYYRAARVKIDLGDPTAAWHILERLDRLAVREEGRRRCLETTRDPALRARWRLRQEKIDQQLLELAALEGPAGGKERLRRRLRRQALRESLQRSARTLPACPGSEETDGPTPSPASWRAFALEDETLLLHRDGEGRVRLGARHSLGRADIASILDSVESLGADPRTPRATAEERWRGLLRPLASAILPANAAELGPVATFGLHGVLQRVPLAALPIEGEETWLADVTTAALRPAGGGTWPPNPVGGAETPGEPVFVVDPRGDLGWTSRLPEVYRRLFPGANLLVRERARVAAVGAALEQASWAHFDTHGRFDEAFPELSGLELADGVLTVDQLSFGRRAPALINLSGCATGRWPTTADSGHYGLGGLLARRGVAWVVATTSTVKDRLMSDFNRGFYAALADGRSPPGAYGAALDSVRRRYPVAQWSRLILLHGASGTDGETSPLRTPSGTEDVRGESTGRADGPTTENQR